MLTTLRNAAPSSATCCCWRWPGGVFAEGVDYPGEMLQAVAVVGPCLPALSLERQLLQEYYEERFERGFEYAFVVPGMTRVVQAAGRLLRSPEDPASSPCSTGGSSRGPTGSTCPRTGCPRKGCAR
jgi:hypothetical protein